MVSTLASKAFPGFSNTYVLWTGSYNTFRGEISSEDHDDAWRMVRAEKTPPGPVVVRYAMGRSKPSDFLYTTSAAVRIISDRVLGILKDGGFTGWRTYPIHLYGKDGKRISGYHGLAVHGRCGPLDDSKSVKLNTIYPGGIFPEWYGLYFDPPTWDGSDLFMTSLPQTWLFVLEPVKRALEKAKVTNMHFTPMDRQKVPRLG